MSSRTITTAGEEIFMRNRLRKSFVVQNEDASINIFIKQEFSGSIISTTDHDHRIAPGGALALNFQNDGEEAIQNRWTIIAASGTPRVSFFETEGIDRTIN